MLACSASCCEGHYTNYLLYLFAIINFFPIIRFHKSHVPEIAPTISTCYISLTLILEEVIVKYKLLLGNAQICDTAVDMCCMCN